jgi:hypothetical protein
MVVALRSFGALTALCVAACTGEGPRQGAAPAAGSGGAGGAPSVTSSGGSSFMGAGRAASMTSGAGGTATGGRAALGGSAGIAMGGAGAATAGRAGDGSGSGAGGMATSSGGAGSGAGGAAATGDGGAPAAGMSGLGPPGPDGFAIDLKLASEIQSTAPTTVGIVRWSLDKPRLTEAHIDFGPDTSYGVTAPVDLTELDYRTVLVGMKPAKAYHFRIVATDGSDTYTSLDQTLTTGAATPLIPRGTVMISQPDKVDEGFVIGSFWSMTNSWTVFILDTDGDVVWWYTDTANNGSTSDGIGRARLSADSRDVWLVNGQVRSPLRRVSIDTLDVQVYAGTAGTHDVCAVSGDTMAYLDSAAGCASIVEIDKAGVTKLVFDSTAATGGACHGNAIRYNEKQERYVFSDRNTDVFVLDRAGTLEWKLSDKVSGGHERWGGVQHGVHLLDASLLIFANEPEGDWQHSQAIEFGVDGTVIQEFTSRGGSDWFGDVQRLPSGNTLINYSLGAIQEIDPNDNVVLQINEGVYLGYTEFRQSLYGPPLDI